MRAEGGAEQIIGVAHVCDPVAQRLVDGILQRFRAGLHAAHLCSHQPHAKDVEGLALHVFGTHAEVFALEKNPRAARVFAEPFSVIQRRRTAAELRE